MTNTIKPDILQVTPEQVAEFWNMFVNRKAYVQQSDLPGGKSGKYYYFRPEVKATKERIPLKSDTIAAHISGWITLAFYAINPKSQACKWLAVDGDYATALDDLKKLRETFAADGIEALSETSRRGGHLWVFNKEPLPAGMLRLYVLNKANMLGVPVKKRSATDGIELFPRQDSVGKGEFGNAIRAPFGVHRASMQRYWFEGALQNVDAQLELIRSVKRLSRAHLEQLTVGLQPVDPPMPKFQSKPISSRDNGKLVVVHLGRHRKSGKNYLTSCPVCDGNGRGMHLSVKIADPTVYHCWHECSPEEIKRALGVDSRQRLQFAA